MSAPSTICASGKIAYPSYDVARKALAGTTRRARDARRRRGSGQSGRAQIYRCPECGALHLGHSISSSPLRNRRSSRP